VIQAKPYHIKISAKIDAAVAGFGEISGENSLS
jgi:hypothetical protein